MSHPDMSGLLLTKARHLVSHLATTGHGQRDLDDLIPLIGKLRLDLEPIEKVKALTMPQLVGRLGSAGLFRG